MPMVQWIPSKDPFGLRALQTERAQLKDEPRIDTSEFPLRKKHLSPKMFIFSESSCFHTQSAHIICANSDCLQNYLPSTKLSMRNSARLENKESVHNKPRLCESSWIQPVSLSGDQIPCIEIIKCLHICSSQLLMLLCIKKKMLPWNCEFWWATSTVTLDYTATKAFSSVSLCHPQSWHPPPWHLSLSLSVLSPFHPST